MLRSMANTLIVYLLLVHSNKRYTYLELESDFRSAAKLLWPLLYGSDHNSLLDHNILN